MPLRPGETVGNYEVVARIGGGATASVFEVRHTALGTRHAMKVLQSQWVDSAELRARFLQEGQLQASFTHPGLVRVTDTVAEPGVAGLVMELLEGETVRDRLDREGYIAPKEAVSWVRAAAEAVQEAHGLGIIHRDLKPENLFLQRTAQGDVLRVLDFGIAKGPEGQHTTQRGALGTCAYMSPEQVRDPSSVDARTDVFALGAVLWELLTGKPAFEGKTSFDSMERVLRNDPAPPSALRSNIPGWLDDLVEAALRKSAGSRFADAGALATALAAGGRGADLPVVPSAVRKSKPSTGFPMWLVAVIVAPVMLGVLVVFVAIGLALYFEPAEVNSLTVSSDLCGVTTIDSTVSGRSGAVSLSLNGNIVASGALPQDGMLHHSATLIPGDAINIEARAGNDSRWEYHTVSGTPMSLQVMGKHGQLAGSVARTLVQVQGTCVPQGLTFEAIVDGVKQTGSVRGSRDFFVDTTGLGTGRHILDVSVIDQGVSVSHTTFVLAVGEKPPADDLDLDGHMSATTGGDDCNDADPNINPSMTEHPDPNGVDDNCDGRIDEGTIAYDDDGDGLSEQDGDCNDADSSIRPGAKETADCRDQDCDDEIDEGLTLTQRDDLYEANDVRADAYDLRTSSKRSFRNDLKLVGSSDRDEGWFRFYSQDGDFDDWGIDVTVPQLPHDSTILLEVFDANGTSRGTTLVEDETTMLRVRGKPFKNDGGDYWLRVSPQRLYAPWCPYTVRVVAR